MGVIKVQTFDRDVASKNQTFTLVFNIEKNV